MDPSSFLAAARTALALSSTPAVRDTWEKDSACVGLTVGGLAHHLLQQVVHTVNLLAMEPVAEPPIPLLDHYARSAWVGAERDDPANLDIARRSNAAAEAGPEEVLAHAENALAKLPDELASCHHRIPDQVHIPWQGWSLSTADFLTTRAMELVVHSDDLAASVGLPTPDFPEDLVADVLGLLTGVAVRRHGQPAVVRALSRPQRAAGHVSAF